MVKLAPGAAVTKDGTGQMTARRPDGTIDIPLTITLRAATPTAAIHPWAILPRDGARAAQLGIDRWVAIDVPPGTDTPALAARLMLASTGSVQWAEIDAVGCVAADAPAPDDPDFPLQWGMENTGQEVNGSTGTSGSDIRARAAWHLSLADHRTIIAVLDSGVHPHVDLGDRILPGWNIPNDSPITDDGCNNHGTHVAGILAAAGDNGTAVAGVAWNARILPVVVVDPCTGLSSWLADGLYYAVDRGATIVNASLQYNVGTQYLRDAVLYTVGADVPVVAAAGNNGFAGVSWPAKWPEVIAVGSLRSDDSPAPTTGQGPEVDVAAPGVDVLSLVGTTGTGFNSGTSMACPHVTGTVALMRSIAPAVGIPQVRAALIGTCVDVQDPGFDDTSGHGRIDAGAAVRALRAIAGPADLNRDGVVNGADLGLLLSAWGGCGVPCPADLNDDGDVNGADLGLLLSAWGSID